MGTLVGWGRGGEWGGWLVSGERGRYQPKTVFFGATSSHNFRKFFKFLKFLAKSGLSMQIKDPYLVFRWEKSNFLKIIFPGGLKSKCAP